MNPPPYLPFFPSVGLENVSIQRLLSCVRPALDFNLLNFTFLIYKINREFLKFISKLKPFQKYVIQAHGKGHQLTRSLLFRKPVCQGTKTLLGSTLLHRRRAIRLCLYIMSKSKIIHSTPSRLHCGSTIPVTALFPDVQGDTNQFLQPAELGKKDLLSVFLLYFLDLLKPGELCQHCPTDPGAVGKGQEKLCGLFGKICLDRHHWCGSNWENYKLYFPPLCC